MKRSSRTITAPTARRGRNVTLTISEEVFRRARHLAVERGVSLSKLLSDELESLVLRDEQYETSRRRLLARMKKGLDLGIRDGRIPWSRDDLHER